MSERKTVLALGFFDGIHIGHAALLERAKQRAAEKAAVPAVLTFDNHPDTFVKGTPVALLNSAEDRAYIVRRFFGIDELHYVHFNEQTMHMHWKTFLENVAAAYNAVHFVVGSDFRFGDRGEGSAALLRQYCGENGLGCDVIPSVEKFGLTVSSSHIRELIAAGEMEKANAMLGHAHLLTGKVRSGFHLGRTMHSPTINMRFEPDVLVPRRGVYASRVILPDGSVRSAVTNIGVRPTFGGESVTVETNIFDFSGDLYGQRVCVELHAFLRPERKFESAEALSLQIRSDAEAAKRFFA